jgi:hypothetical protein
VRSYDKPRGSATAEIEAPAGISSELVHEVEARGWRIIAGGAANPEAEHDSWAFGGVPAREFGEVER